MFFKATYHTWKRIFSSSSVFWCTILTEVSFLMVPVFCDKIIAMLVVECDTGKRNHEIPLDIVQEKCTGRSFRSDGFFGFYGPKGALGSQKYVEEVSEVCQETLCSPLFYSLSNVPLVDQALLNLTTRWRFSAPDYCKILLISPWTKVLQLCMYKIYVVLMHIRYNR